jgi:hypothetical protein
MTQNDQKRPQMAQNDPKRLKMTENDPQYNYEILFGSPVLSTLAFK